METRSLSSEFVIGAMAAAAKKKAPTKGSKQILTENTATVLFYRNMSAASLAGHILVMITFYSADITIWDYILNILMVIIYTGCYQFMKTVSRPQYTDDNQLLDPGLDLNMEGGMGEHVKDIVILCSTTHILTLLSGYFWLLLLLVPFRGFWLLWTNILGPWFFQEAPEQEVNEKKKKKLENRLKRQKM